MCMNCEEKAEKITGIVLEFDQAKRKRPVKESVKRKMRTSLNWAILGYLWISMLRRLLFVALGLAAMALGALGVWLPGLPATPFVLVALWACRLFREHLPSAKFLAAEAVGALILLGIGFAAADRITDLSEAHLFSDEVIYSKTTPYQRIVVTRNRDDLRLYLNGHLQFSSFDEYRYHEVLVHPGLAAVAKPDRVLVLGGGDGLAIREILRDPRVGTITLVDLDPGMTALFRDHPTFSQLNGLSLRHPKVSIVNADAFIWIKETPGLYDFIVVDFPDPSNFSLGKLYTTTFYIELRKHLAQGGAAVVQSTSPLFARQSFWCIAATMRSVGLTVTPCHVYVPSFGEWGFMLATHGAYTVPTAFPAGLRFLNPETAKTLFDFGDDMKPVPAEINRLNNQILVHYYDAEWRKIAP